MTARARRRQSGGSRATVSDALDENGLRFDPPGQSQHRPSLVRSRPRQPCPVRPSSDAAPWRPARRRSEEPPSSRRTAARALYRPAALAPDAAVRRTRQGGEKWQASGYVFTTRTGPGRAAERLPLLHPHRRFRRHPSRPAARRPARYGHSPHGGRSPRVVMEILGTARSASPWTSTRTSCRTHSARPRVMDRLLRGRPGRQ